MPWKRKCRSSIGPLWHRGAGDCSRPGRDPVDRARASDLAASHREAHDQSGPRAGAEKGNPRRRRDADITIIDPRDWTVDPSRFASKSSNSPFAGWKLTAAPRRCSSAAALSIRACRTKARRLRRDGRRGHDESGQRLHFDRDYVPFAGRNVLCPTTNFFCPTPEANPTVAVRRGPPPDNAMICPSRRRDGGRPYPARNYRPKVAAAASVRRTARRLSSLPR